MTDTPDPHDSTEKRRPKIDRYDVIRGLGKGAWGAVYLAHDPKLAREVAIKVLHREFFDNQKYRARFEREARAIAALKHPNIVEMYDYGHAGTSRLFIVMEYLDGPHLGFLEREYGPLPETIVLAVGHELCRALGCAHGAGVIHRDLKPENVFIVNGRLVLADFGIVKAFVEDSPLGREAADPRTEIIGTPGFMAPEQLKREPLGGHTDIFSVGALLYFLATSRLAFEAASPYALAQRFASGEVESPQRRRPILSDGLDSLLLNLLAIDPADRPASIGGIQETLATLLTKRGVTDVREELARFTRDPAAYTEYDRVRVVGRAQDQFYLALDEAGPDAARRWLTFINRIDPDKAHILGAILDKRAHRGRGRWRWIVVALVGLAAAGGIGYLVHDALVSHERPAPLRTIFVTATARTEILYKGKVLGYTPKLRHVALRGHRLRLVFRTRGKPTLEYYLDPETAAGQVLHVDWDERQVSLRAKVRRGTK